MQSLKKLILIYALFSGLYISGSEELEQFNRENFRTTFQQLTEFNQKNRAAVLRLFGLHKREQPNHVAAEHKPQTVNNAQIDKLLNRKANTKVIGGVPQEIQDIVNFLNEDNLELYKKVGASRLKGIILVAPPGCGKTLIAKWIATQTDAQFIEGNVNNNGIIYGAGRVNIELLFTQIKHFTSKGQQVIVFLDEIDSIGKRTNPEGINSAILKDNNDTINEFLKQMDGYDELSENIVFIGATNFPKGIDPALLRPGRFGKIIYIPLPDKDKRAAIIKHYFDLKPRETQIDDINTTINKIADMTEGFSGADLAELVNATALEAVHNKRGYIIEPDFIAALNSMIESKNSQNISFFQ